MEINQLMGETKPGLGNVAAATAGLSFPQVVFLVLQVVAISSRMFCWRWLAKK